MLVKSVCFWVFLFLSSISWASESRLSVVASIRPLALLAQDLVGEWVDVDIVVPPNADPHNMSLKSSARSKLDNADLVLWLGPEFERFLAKPMRQRKSTVDIAVEDIQGLFNRAVEEELRGAEEHAGHEHGEHHHPGHHGRDLHVWLNPKNAELILRVLADRLSVLKPELKGVIAQRLVRIIADIKIAQKTVATKLSPYGGKGFGVYHNAYGHFVGVFGLNMIAAVNQMPEQRISARHMYQLQKDMVDASCIVVERKSEKTERLARVLRVKQVEADPLASSEGIKSYKAFLLYLGLAFESCFNHAI